MDLKQKPSKEKEKEKEKEKSVDKDSDSDSEFEKGKNVSLTEVELWDDEESSIAKKFGDILVVMLKDGEFTVSTKCPLDKAHGTWCITVLGQINGGGGASSICDCKANNTTIVQMGLMRIDIQTTLKDYVVVALQNNVTSKGQNKADWESVQTQAHKHSVSYSSVQVYRTCKSSSSFALAFREAHKLSVNNHTRFRMRPIESETSMEKEEKKEKKKESKQEVEFKESFQSAFCNACYNSVKVPYNPNSNSSLVDDNGYLNGTCPQCKQTSVPPKFDD